LNISLAYIWEDNSVTQITEMRGGCVEYCW